jgi:hypothetical protein
MHTQATTNANDRMATILWGNTWALNFILFALLVDIMVRSLVLNEAAWDLFALIGISGIVSVAYAARHNVLVFNRKSIAVLALTAVIAAIVSAILAMTKAM